MSTAAPLSFRVVLIRFALVALIVAAVDFAFGCALDRARNRCTQRESGLIRVGRESAADVLILGSSRAKHHFDEKLLSKAWGVSVYNAGFSGQGVPFARVVFELIAQKHRPKLVIVDAMSFADDLDRVHAFDPWWSESARLREMPESDSPAGVTRVDAVLKNRILMVFSTYRYAGKAWMTLKDTYHFGEAPNFEPLPVLPNPDLRPPHEDLRKFPRHAPQLAALVDEIRATGADVVFTFSPVTRAADCSALIEPAREVARAKQVPFYPFRSDSVPGMEESRHFSDHVHLNGDGARLFTHHVAEILRPHLPQSSAP